VSAWVPPGKYQHTVQVVFTDASTSTGSAPTGNSKVVAFGFGVYNHGVEESDSGAAITATVRAPNINTGSTVYEVSGSGLHSVAGAQFTKGSAVFTFTGDPTFEVTSPSPTTHLTSSASGGHRK